VVAAPPNQAAKLERARLLAEQAINDPEFRRRVYHFSSVPYGGKPGDGYRHAERAQPIPHVVTSNEEVVQALLDGNGLGGKIYLRVEVTRDHTSLDDFARTPFEVPGGITSIFPDWLDHASDAVVAENLVHEHLHRLGFEHEHSFSVKRCGSAPYAVGKLVCAKSAGDQACFPVPPEKC
jgi:hypothetical protein